MSLKRERVHTTGLSNIDFRSKNDSANLDQYEPWHKSREFGTMSQYPYDLSYTEHKKLFRPTLPINEQYYLNADIQNPKIYKSAQFYKNHKIRLNTKAIYTNERFAQLDESNKGKEIFLGDSMMISDINKQRKERKRRRKFNDKENKEKKMVIQNQIIADKINKNKEAIQETQLVKIEAKKTLEGRVDMKKLQEIRLALRRRYANRTNFRKIFQDWQRSAQGEITTYDAHHMINDLNIPINYNETRALISSANKRGTFNLDLPEFMSLIFDDNPILKVDLSNIEFKDEETFEEGEVLHNLKKQRELKVLNPDDIDYFEQYFKTKKPILLKYIKDLGYDKQDTCPFEVFEKAVKKFPIPVKYISDDFLQSIYNAYKVPDKDEMDYKKYLNYLVTPKDKEDFYDFQKKDIAWLTDKIKRTEIETKKAKETFAEELKRREKLKLLYLQQINEQKKQNLYNTMASDTFSHCQPSTNFINLVYKEREQNFKDLNKAEKSFEALPSLISENQRKTRFGATPIFDTKGDTEADPKSFLYLSEENRFKIRGKDSDNFNNNNRYWRLNRNKANVDKRRKEYSKYSDDCTFHNEFHNAMDALGQVNRTQNMLEYEIINRIQNEFIE